jgi:hypothetical protein
MLNILLLSGCGALKGRFESAGALKFVGHKGTVEILTPPADRRVPP